MQTAVAQKKIKAFPLFMGQSGCDFHRIRLPFMYGGQYWEHELHEGFQVERMLEYIEACEVLVFNRNFALGLPKLKELKAKSGFAVVADLDDWCELPSYHPNYQQYRDWGWKEIIETIKFADCVTVTTDRLYQRLKGFNKNVHVIPNALPYDMGQFVDRPSRDDSGFDFVYTGLGTHLEDVRLMQAAINKASRLPGVSFSLAGYKPFERTGTRTWELIEKVFNRGQYRRIEHKPLDSYMTVYDDSDCLLVPLCINEFNKCKSNLKFLEAAAKRMPVIVSQVPPYSDDAEAPVMWVSRIDDWYRQMKYAAENPNYSKDLGMQLYEWAKRKYDLHKWNKTRFELYQAQIR